MATEVYFAKAKQEDTKYWDEVGLKVFITPRSEGGLKVGIFDARTGKNYPCFPPFKKDDNRQKRQENDDMPF